jgi:hypothetical protein
MKVEALNNSTKEFSDSLNAVNQSLQDFKNSVIEKLREMDVITTEVAKIAFETHQDSLAADFEIQEKRKVVQQFTDAGDEANRRLAMEALKCLCEKRDLKKLSTFFPPADLVKRFLEIKNSLPSISDMGILISSADTFAQFGFGILGQFGSLNEMISSYRNKKIL